MNPPTFHSFCGYLHAITAAVALACYSPARAATYYVATTGNDTNPGTSAAPFKTITRARDVLRPLIAAGLTENMVVRIKAGTYRVTAPITLSTQDSGTASYSITYQADTAAAKPVISGAKLISTATYQWARESAGSNVWRIYIPEVASGAWWFRELYAGTALKTRSREPDFSSSTDWQFGAWVPTTDPAYPATNGPWQLTSPGLFKISAFTNSTRSNFNFTGSAVGSVTAADNAEVVLYCDWSQLRCKLNSAGGNSLSAVGRVGIANFFARDATIGRSFYLEHAKSFVDTAGEWFLSETGYLYYYSTTDPSSLSFSAPATATVLEVAGGTSARLRNMRFTNLIFEGASGDTGLDKVFSTQGHFYKNDSTMVAAALPSGVKLSNIQDSTVSYCGFRNMGGTAISFLRGCRDCLFEYNEISNAGGGGLVIGENIGPEKDLSSGEANNSLRMTARQNKVHDYGLAYSGCCGIWQAWSPNTLIERNLVYNGSYSGISVGWEWTDIATRQRDVIVRRNEVHDVMARHYDGSGIYAVGNQDGGLITLNLVHDNTNGKGIQCDQGSSYLEISKNTVHHTGTTNLGCGIALNDGHDRTVTNNVLGYTGAYRALQIGALSLYGGVNYCSFTRNVFVDDTNGYTIASSGLDDWNNLSSTVVNNNIYWTAQGSALQRFDSYLFSAWKALGYDANSFVNFDPDFTNPGNGDFSLSAAAAAALTAKTGFVDWDKTNVGPDW